MRHGKSSLAEAGLSDFNRPLKNRGIKEAGFVVEKLNKSDIKPDRIISSPANRAKSTAMLIAKGLKLPLEKVLLEPAIYDALLNDVLRIISTTSCEINTLMLFGHNPALTDVANHFGHPVFNLPPCGCLGFELEIENWKDVRNANVKNSFQIIPSELH
jgi:phosphohistidine phosphatase